MIKGLGKSSSILEGKHTVAEIVAACLLALVLAVGYTVWHLEEQLHESTNSVADNFGEIMNHYNHSFKLINELLSKEITAANGDPEAIEAYLKTMDKRLEAIEGKDYDGVYMYYKEKYLYSWDTPHEVYEKRGYRATERPWYKGAVAAGGDICVATPYRSFANSYMLTTISRLQPDKKTVIAYDLKLGAVETYVNKLNIYNDSLTLLYDFDGNIIGSTDTVYTGGNFFAERPKLEQELKEAQEELVRVTTDQYAKAKAKVDNKQAVIGFTDRFQDFARAIIAAPADLHFLPKELTFGYAFNNGHYGCLVLIPFTKLLPQILGIWAVLSLVLVLFLLLIENTRGKLRNAQVIANKNEALAAALAQADAATVAKSQFLAQMSHEIRTPMNAIVGLTSIAKTEIHNPEKVSDYLNKIDGSSKLLLGIINDVLDMSAIEGGKLKIDQSAFNFRTMLTNITTVFYEQTRQKGINFEVRMNGVTEEVIVGDELRVNQVLMNFLSNAVKFTPPGGQIDLMVLQASRSQGKLMLRFSVSDTGCGMSEDMLGRLFKPFEQESASTARKHGGSGLGLSIAKKLVTMMGGSIQVNSTLGKGTVFTADIPFMLPDNAQATEQHTDTFKEIHTLVVDDDKESCEYCGILLERLGVRHEYVTNGEAALEALGEAEDKGDPFNLCLVDWKMPDMDGGQLTQQIREIFGKDYIVIIVSAYDLNELETSGKHIEADYFVPKPLFQSTLFNALMRISGGDYTKVEAETAISDYDFTGKHVLLAEDVALNMEVAVKLLNMVGIEVTCAEDGKQAVDLFQKSAEGYYDCVLMDINMPVMDGYDATKAIRKLNRGDAKTTTIYAMTANAFSEDVTAALNAGMNGHIAKPIETKILYKTLQEAFKDPAEEKA